MKVRIISLFMPLIAAVVSQAQRPTSLPLYPTGTPVNFIRSWIAKAPLSNSNTLMQKGIKEVQQETQYFDGLGRPLQTVIKKGALATFNTADLVADTINAKDFVSTTLYDEFGRVRYKFMEFPSLSSNDGSFKFNPYVQQQGFVDAQFASQGFDKDYSYNQTIYEPSPLGRVKEMFSPGASWAGSATQSIESERRSLKQRYWLNSSTDSVVRWRIQDVSDTVLMTKYDTTITITTSTTGFYLTILRSGGAYQQVTYNWPNSMIGSATMVQTCYRESPSSTWIKSAGSPVGPRVQGSMPRGDFEYALEFYSSSGSNMVIYTPATVETVFSNPHTETEIKPAIGKFGKMSSNSFYERGQLFKLIKIDEAGKQVIEFRDSYNQLLLKKVQFENAVTDDGSGKGHWGWLCTYYIYDDFRTLRAVVQPEGVKWLSQNNWDFYGQNGSQILAEQCFRYEYDAKNRMIIRQIPGAAPVNFVYNSKNLLVMSQDGKLKDLDMWTYIKYDTLNRTIATGVFSSSENLATHRQNADGSTDYPTTMMLTGVQPMTETFYDDYSWVSQAPYSTDLTGKLNATFTTDDTFGHLLPASDLDWPYPQQPGQDNRVKGLITGSRIKVLNSNTYTYSLTLYDDHERAIQQKSLNHTGGVDVTTSQYSWSGQPLLIISRQNKATGTGTSILTITKNSYDVLGRLIAVSNRVKRDAGALNNEKILTVNKYNDLGQLSLRSLSPADMSGSVALEKQAFEYNIRGSLLGMNRGYVNNATGSATNFFGFDLAYDKTNNNANGQNNVALANYLSAQYSGNIAGVTWRSQNNGAPIRRYDFTYDNANRLLKADFGQLNGSQFSLPIGMDFSVKMGATGTDANTAYDYNGNIKMMVQKGTYDNTAITMDSLVYSYNPNSNKLKAVSENGIDTKSLGLGDFNDGSNGAADDYSYDINGNLTKDLNKGISNIGYNLFGLPEEITVTGKGTISYLYDATGAKLSKTVNEMSPTAQVTTTTYVGGMVFENDELRYIAAGDVRLRPTVVAPTTLVYDYFLKDHLGNIRAVITDDASQSNKLLEENHYYPFGLIQKGISSSAVGASTNKFKYNSIEQTDVLGLNQLEAFFRTMDPQIGRWLQIDPKPNVFESPFAAMGNNPIFNRDPLGDTVIDGRYYENNKNGGVLDEVFVSSQRHKPESSAGTFMPMGLFGMGPMSNDPLNILLNADWKKILSNVWDGFAGGAKNTVENIKHTFTVEGIIETVVDGSTGNVTMIVRTTNGLVKIVSNIANYSDDDIQYGAGFILEKALEAIILKRVLGRLGRVAPVSNAAEAETVNQVPTSSLRPTHYITRSKTQMQALLNDIRSNGIQEPIKYVEQNGIKYIVDGHHRYYSAQRLGIQDVPVQQVQLPYGGYQNGMHLMMEPGKQPGFWKNMK
ncbi:MAG: ParB N-terminal domain-containing protein [Niabella sp.]|nr:ParB N-terminal domain-containing protein [Niabella sp.]